MKNQYLDQLKITDDAIAIAENVQIERWIYSLIQQYHTIRVSTSRSAEDLRGSFDFLYFLPQEILINGLIFSPLERPPSDNYKEFLLALYHILPHRYKDLWFKLELSAGYLAAHTVAFQHLRLNEVSSLAIIQPDVSSEPSKAKSSEAEVVLESQDNQFVSMVIPNLNQHPGVDITHPLNSDVQITMGDGHGNVIRMIHFLVYQGVMVLSEVDYSRLVEIYYELSTLVDQLGTLNDIDTSAKDIAEITEKIKPILDEFIRIMRTKSSFNTVGLVRWMGDLLGDRGVLDYLVLELLDCMKNAGVRNEIMLSNHDLNLILWYELCLNNPGALIDLDSIASQLPTTPNESLENMLLLIDLGILNHHDIFEMINNCYKPALKLVSYTTNQSGTKGNLFTHAPVQGDVLPAIAQRLGLRFETHSLRAFLRSIDNINTAIQVYVQTNSLMTILNPTIESFVRGFDPNKYNPAANPFINLLWNKDPELMPIPPIAGCKFVLVHGHEIVQAPRPGFEGLDSLLGKEIYYHTAEARELSAPDRDQMIYRILHSRQSSVPTPRLTIRPASHAEFFAPARAPRSEPHPAPPESETEPSSCSEGLS